MAGPLAASLAVHGAVVGAFAISARVSWPAPPIPVEMVLPHRTVKATGPAEVPQPKAPTPVAKARPPRKSGAGANPLPPSLPSLPATVPPQTTDLRPFAPDDAHLVVLLCANKLRRSPHRAGIEALVGAVPDYRMLIDGTGLTVMDDFEALLFATSNLRDPTATFFAARFPDGSRLRTVISRPIRSGDARVFRVLAPGLAVLTQPGDAARLDAAAHAEAAHADGGSDDARARWLAELERFDRVSREAGGPAVVVTLSDAPSLFRLGDGLPTPSALALAATADAAAAVRIQLVFATVEEAEKFAAAWPGLVLRWRQKTALLGLGPALDQLALSRDGARLELAGHVPEAQLRIGLAFARALIPQPQASGDVDGGEPPR